MNRNCYCANIPVIWTVFFFQFFPKVQRKPKNDDPLTLDK